MKEGRAPRTPGFLGPASEPGVSPFCAGFFPLLWHPSSLFPWVASLSSFWEPIGVWVLRGEAFGSCPPWLLFSPRLSRPKSSRLASQKLRGCGPERFCSSVSHVDAPHGRLSGCGVGRKSWRDCCKVPAAFPPFLQRPGTGGEEAFKLDEKLPDGCWGGMRRWVLVRALLLPHRVAAAVYQQPKGRRCT